MRSNIYDPRQQVSLLQQTLSGSKKAIGILLGAGCPMAVSCVESDAPLIPGIVGITECVRQHLTSCTKFEQSFDKVTEQLRQDGNSTPTVEDMLTHIRSLSEVAGNDKVRGLDKAELEQLDEKICNLIHEIVDQELPRGATPYHSVALWANAIPREFAVQIFTTNYDLLIEQALEESRVPYFDGFSGVRKPLFDPQLLEDDSMPEQWTRLWKLHGSINWHLNENRQVFRGNTKESAPKRVIHPSHLKYQESRRMPYLAMADKMRAFMKIPASALIICGYSFADDHINENIVQGLQYTQTAVAFALMYGKIECHSKVVALAQKRPNLNVLAEDGGIIGGQECEWIRQETEDASAFESCALTWEPTNSSKQQAKFNLGNFEAFGQFLRELVTIGASLRHS